MSRIGSGAFVPAYRPGPSALHTARAGVAASFCASLALIPLLYEHPLVLGAGLAAVVAAAAAAGVSAEVGRAARLAVPLALLFALVNPLVSQEGRTLLVRGGEVLGRRFDVTLEALVYGGTAGLRILVLVLAFALFSATVDPDEMLRLFRRVSYRSALTASLATRLVPVLARDATRMSDASRCRPVPPGRAAVARAALRGALDRAVDLAAALELRGYASAVRPRRAPAIWSRHDIRVALGAAALAATALGARVAGVAAFDPYPDVRLTLGPPELALLAALPVLALAPFAGPAARLGVARA